MVTYLILLVVDAQVSVNGEILNSPHFKHYPHSCCSYYWREIIFVLFHDLDIAKSHTSNNIAPRGLFQKRFSIKSW